ncbi:hypothetical protein [Streptomyces sp. NPDC045470]|uniref:hypothetical protein n=1 Tax=Streptomyces sp. NPDC045470 TaxID=3155469 RepID=UPI00340D0B03
MGFAQTKELRADVSGQTGRLRAWTTEREPGVVSVAVPGDRVTLSAADARALAAWLAERAVEEDRNRMPTYTPSRARRTTGWAA